MNFIGVLKLGSEGKKFTWSTLLYGTVGTPHHFRRVVINNGRCNRTFLDAVYWVDARSQVLDVFGSCKHWSGTGIGKGFYLDVITEGSILTTISLLQGMLCLRVYILFGKPRSILFVLGPCFIVTQVINIICCLLFVVPSERYWVKVLVTNSCALNLNFAKNRMWAVTASNTAVLAFEVVLCAFALGYASKHLPAWRLQGQRTTSLAWIILRDNFAYFFIALVTAIFSTIDQVPLLSNTFISAMAGPWLILGLRMRYWKEMEAETTRSSELMTVAFASAPRQVESQDSGPSPSLPA
ncbi:hypothetical protein CONPUDRAFT_77290 [Coniophora puteana RWD-64-598 SS2]|uniref:Uncharacterized protein n=1 Tax=Coniophora puteana (strain RWD-64-598) TaxID=741705 RepID=A0A5M3MA34_CONPW|nr:uncharacterized protein CONPUDRAFT_77290 [Coniophora puteana RWD-64-598 SS2]EIW75650.1 hypothetical protein CONPUDRAFT_77290 [Coniophora puteana RWD-64-598 SS2]